MVYSCFPFTVLNSGCQPVDFITLFVGTVILKLVEAVVFKKYDNLLV